MSSLPESLPRHALLRSHAWALAAILAGSLALRLAAAVPLDLFQDEALYWWGAGKPELSFCPRPPGAASLGWGFR